MIASIEATSTPVVSQSISRQPSHYTVADIAWGGTVNSIQPGACVCFRVNRGRPPNGTLLHSGPRRDGSVAT